MILRTTTVTLFCAIFFDTSSTGRGNQDIGDLVETWSKKIEDNILQLAQDGVQRDKIQGLFDEANYVTVKADGMEVVRSTKEILRGFFEKKEKAAHRLADEVRLLHDTFKRLNNTGHLGPDTFRDADPVRQPNDTKYNPLYVNFNQSSVKIPDDVPQDDRNVTDAIVFTAQLDEVFKKNAVEDPLLRWQYFGSSSGFLRIYPAKNWNINFVGFYTDYDPRTRPWYIAATSGPKDVLVILDCSMSMSGEKFSIAKAVAKVVIDTLTKQDYVGVMCARSSHWDDIGTWHEYSTEVLGCKKDQLVPATLGHRKYLVKHVQTLEAGGTTELEKGFEMGFRMLGRNVRTGCQSVIVFVTDGQDTDGEHVRCKPGYYTRSGFVPGETCKYDWAAVWNVVDKLNRKLDPQARIFSYLVQGDAEILPGKLACSHRGSLKKLTSADNLISQMSNYYNFLSSNTKSDMALWTSPYLDFLGQGLMVTYSISIISGVTENTVGVIGIDTTLGEIEVFLTKHQWGSVYSFLVSHRGETIFHPLLKPSSLLVDDPLFTPIARLEEEMTGHKINASIFDEMIKGKTGYHEMETNPRRTYYYSDLSPSEYSFAYSLADNDKMLPGVYKLLNLTENLTLYPDQKVSHEVSSVFLSPRAYCDPSMYIYDDNPAHNTLYIHKRFRSQEPDNACNSTLESKYQLDKGIRTAVLLSQGAENIWKKRNFTELKEVKWTYLGLHGGVLRAYPGHRSPKIYDPTKEEWYKRASRMPGRTFVSTPQMALTGDRKMVAISQAVFQGMPFRTDEECAARPTPKPAGCRCNSDQDCKTAACYATGNRPDGSPGELRCSAKDIEGVAGMNITYGELHKKVMRSVMGLKQRTYCGDAYRCADGEDDCETRCYLFDGDAHLVVDSEFLSAATLDIKIYEDVTLGSKEGEVMKELIYKHGLFRQTEILDIQGACQISPDFLKVTLKGNPLTPEERDNYYKTRGPIRHFNNQYGCVQDIVEYKVNDSALGLGGLLSGSVSGPCVSGSYYVKALRKTNLYLLVLHNRKSSHGIVFYPFNCHIAQSVVNSGVSDIVNGTCVHEDLSAATRFEETHCPLLHNIHVPCVYTTGGQLYPTLTSLLPPVLNLLYSSAHHQM